MFLSGVQSEFHLDSRLKHAGMTDFGRSKLRGINPRRLKTTPYRTTVVHMLLTKKKAVRLTQEVKAAG